MQKKDKKILSFDNNKAKSMEDLDESISSGGCESLFIREEETESDTTLMEPRECTAQSGLTFTGTRLNPSAFIRPYLEEMDDMLMRSCEELSSLPLGSQASASHNETRLTKSANSHSKEGEEVMEGYEEKNAYLVTSYIDTHVDRVGTEKRQAQEQSQDLGGIVNRCGVNADVSHQGEMPLTSAGHKLSNTMVAYEDQLLGMLAMLENCMEEAGMDFEHQDWATDTSQEYVHISKNSHLRRGTTLVPIQQVRVETQPMLSETWAGQHARGDEIFQGCETEGKDGSAATVGQHNPALSCDSMGGFSMEQLGKQGNLETNYRVLDPQFGFLDPTMPVDCIQHEMPKTGYMSTDEDICSIGDVTAIGKDNTGSSVKDGEEPNVESSDLGSYENELGALWSRMEECIEEVQQVKKRRRELLAEVVELRGDNNTEKAERSNDEDTDEQTECKVVELMKALTREEEGRREERKKEIQDLREERAEEERRIWKVNLERQGLQDELRRLKRRLFNMARDCAQSQFSFNTQHREVEQLKREEEELQSTVHQLTEELSQLRTAHKQQMLELQEKLSAQSSSQTSNIQEELTQCKRRSCGDIQQYLQAGLKALEDRFEPILLALLKRREAAAGALVKAREQAQELKAQLRPLKEENQELKLKRACLEEKLKLIHMQRREDVKQYKETVHHLEESTRELKTQLKLQKIRTKEMEELRDSLSKQLLLYRAAIEDHNKCGKTDKT